MGRTKIHNEYEREAKDALGGGCPKAVFAAIAYSLAMRLCCDNEGLAKELMQSEWHTLYMNNIVPQAPK